MALARPVHNVHHGVERHPMSLTAGSAGSKNDTKSFITALVANGGLLIVEVGAFLFLKARLGRIYSPRTYLPPPACVVVYSVPLAVADFVCRKRAQLLPDSTWKWLPALLFNPTEDIVRRQSTFFQRLTTVRSPKMALTRMCHLINLIPDSSFDPLADTCSSVTCDSSSKYSSYLLS